MQKVINRGFTLIELLVVIAIIGILAAIVLVSLGSARSKGADASIQGNLNTIRTQMELYASNNSNNYNNGCSDTTVNAALNGAANAGGFTVVTAAGTAGTASTVVCHATSSAGWAVQSPLKSGGFWCVDASGKASTSTSNLIAADDGAC